MKIIKYINMIILLVLLSGCSSKYSKELVLSYAQNTKSVTTTTQDLFHDIEYTRLNSKSLVLLTKGTSVKINELKFNELNTNGVNQTLAYLNDFASALIELSDDSKNKSLSDSMNKLNGSLSNLNDTLNDSIDNKTISNISTIIFSIESLYLDSQKYDKLKNIVKLSEKSISKKLYNLADIILEYKKPYIRALKEERRRLLKVANYPHHYFLDKNNKKIHNT